jgi:hypothetical protein
MVFILFTKLPTNEERPFSFARSRVALTVLLMVFVPPKRGDMKDGSNETVSILVAVSKKGFAVGPLRDAPCTNHLR